MTNILEMCFCLHFVDIGTYTIQLCLHNLFLPLCLLATSTCWLTLQLYTIWVPQLSAVKECVSLLLCEICATNLLANTAGSFCACHSLVHSNFCQYILRTYTVLSQWRQIENCFLHPTKWGCPLGVSMQFVPDYLSAEESADIAVVPNWHHLVHQIAETLGQWVCSWIPYVFKAFH